MRLTILNVAYPLFPVSPSSSGGAEQILQLIDQALFKDGHRSIVIAAAGSAISGELVETDVSRGEITPAIREAAQRQHRLRIDETVRAEKIDLIHFHGLDFLSYRPDNPICQLATLHLPLEWYAPDLFHQAGLNLNCVSANQALSRTETRFAPVISNGIELSRFTFMPEKEDYLLWLGRLCPEKGVDIALRVARAAGQPIVIAGPVHPFKEHQRYFQDIVAPLLDEKRRYIGPVSSGQRAELLSGARCLLIPALAAETSSLVAMEAAASGTPVIAFSAGALPEVVEHGRTGWIVSSETDMVEAVRQPLGVIPAVCRQTAEKRFSADRMTQQYLNLYKALIRECA